VSRRVGLDLDEYFPYLINRVGVALVTGFEAQALRRHHLSIAMWRVLAALSANGGQRLVDLSAMTSIDVSTLSRMVTRLIRLGLATRARSQKSEREIVVRLTSKGRTIVAGLIPIALRFEQRVIAGIPEGDLPAVKRALKQMHANLAGHALLVAPRRRV
jgi:MarR family transcriptional regulator, organic hydroperoxide resistance regulator